MASSKPVIELDGRTLEGGGQLLRIAVGLSALTRSPVHIPNVRQNRDQPGLKAQHAAGLSLVARICSAHAEGIEKGSQDVSFDPTSGCIQRGHYEADPGTAGSTTLLMQVSLPVLLFAEPGPEPQEQAPSDQETITTDGDVIANIESAMKKEEVYPSEEGLEWDESLTASTLTLRGGTNALNAPQADYALHVLIPFLLTHILPSPTSHQLRLDIKQRGFYPHGGGHLRATISSLRKGQALRSIELTERGTVVSVWGKVVVSGVIGRRVANEMREAALLELIALSPECTSLPHSAIQIEVESNPEARAGSSIILIARTSTGCVLAGSALGSKGVKAEQTGMGAARELVRHLEEGGCVDGWMQDQMIVFLALAKGRSVVRTGNITLHTRTAIWVAERMTDAKFEVKENINGTEQSLIICDGVGLEGRL